MNITYNGETKTIEEWSKHLKISLKTIKQRLEKQMDIEDVLKVTERKQTEKYITYNGITDTIKGWSERTGKSEVMLRRDLFYRDDPLSVEEALTRDSKREISYNKQLNNKRDQDEKLPKLDIRKRVFKVFRED